MEWRPKPRVQLSAAMDMTRWAWFEAALYCPGAKSPAAAVNRPPFAQSAMGAQEGVRGGMLRALPRPPAADVFDYDDRLTSRMGMRFIFKLKLMILPKKRSMRIAI